MKISTVGVGVIALALISLGHAQTVAGSGMSRVGPNSKSIELGNADDPDPVPPAAVAAAPAKPGASAATAAAAAADGADDEKKKVDPLTQHRLNMIEQSKPENYMQSNTAVSRRYLMIDKATYQSRMSQ